MSGTSHRKRPKMSNLPNLSGRDSGNVPPLVKPTWGGNKLREEPEPPGVPSWVAEDHDRHTQGFAFRIDYRSAAYLAAAIMFAVMWVFFDPQTGLVTNLPWGGALILGLLLLTFATMVICFNHITLRKILFPYVDIQKLVDKAVEQGNAGSALLAIALFMVSVAITFVGVVYYICQR